MLRRPCSDGPSPKGGQSPDSQSSAAMSSSVVVTWRPLRVTAVPSVSYRYPSASASIVPYGYSGVSGVGLGAVDAVVLISIWPVCPGAASSSGSLGMQYRSECGRLPVATRCGRVRSRVPDRGDVGVVRRRDGTRRALCRWREGCRRCRCGAGVQPGRVRNGPVITGAQLTARASMGASCLHSSTAKLSPTRLTNERFVTLDT